MQPQQQEMHTKEVSPARGSGRMEEPKVTRKGHITELEYLPDDGAARRAKRSASVAIARRD